VIDPHAKIWGGSDWVFTAAFRSGMVLAMDGLSGLIDAEEIQVAIRRLIDNVSEAGNGNIIMGLSGPLPRSLLLEEESKTFFLDIHGLEDRSKPENALELSIDDHKLLDVLETLRFAEPLEVLKLMYPGFTREKLVQLINTGLVQERAGLYSSTRTANEGASIGNLQEIADGYLAAVKKKNPRQTHYLLEAEHFYRRSEQYPTALRMALLYWEGLRFAPRFVHSNLKAYVQLALKDRAFMDQLDFRELLQFNDAFHTSHIGAADLEMEEVPCKELEIATRANLSRRYPEIADGLVSMLRGLKGLRNGDPDCRDELMRAEARLSVAHHPDVVAEVAFWLSGTHNPKGSYPWAKLAASLFKGLGLMHSWAMAQDNMAAALSGMEDYQAAFRIASQSREYYSSEEGYSSGKASSNGTLFKCELALGDIDAAEGYFHESNLNCIQAANYGMLLNHFTILLDYAVRGGRSLDSAWPSKRAIYKSAVNIIPIVASSRREELHIQPQGIFMLRFADCLVTPDKSGCIEVIEDATRMKSEFGIEGLEKLTQKFKDEFRQTFRGEI